MTDKRPTPDQTAGKGRRKRTAPTIDLTATEVPPAAGEAPPPPPPETPAVEPVAAAPEPEPAPRGSDAPSANEAPQAGPSQEPRKNSDKSFTAALTMPVLAAGVTGALVMSVILLTMWLTGLLPIRFATLTMTRARVTALEMQIQDLQKRPAAPVAADTAVIDALTKRVAAMETSIKNLPSPSAPDTGLTERVAAADNALKSLGVALAALNKRNDDLAANTTQARERAEAAEKAVADLRGGLQDVSKTASAGASSADLEPLQQRIAALEQAAKAAQAQIAKTSASDNAARLALAAATLRDAVLRGAPFADELTQVKALGADDKLVAPLTPFAASGIPNEKTLAAELAALLPGMVKAAGAPPASAGFIERLQANASQLVRVRPVDAPAGDDAATVLARLDIDTARADIAAALADLGKLSEAQRAPAQGWIAKAKARQAAAAAARQIATETSRALGSR